MPGHRHPRLYGTTYQGGYNDYGTVFVITPSGSERVLYSGSRSNETMYAPSGLVVMDGVLYGSSQGGGKSEVGAVYSLTTSGDLRVVYSFHGN
ncbi:MAG: choice-of-anchor tandem repeat GloVer-containing protein, partial [Candidatus Cybelea sp.]